MIRFFMMFLMALLLMSFPFAAQAASFSQRAAGMAEIKDIRVSTTADRARLVVDATKEVDYDTVVLSNPGRVVVNMTGAWLSPAVKKSLSLDSRFAGRVRIAQFNPNTVRIVVETTMGRNNYEVFSLKGGEAPYRIVMDFGNLGKGSAGAAIKFPGHGSDGQSAKPADKKKSTGQVSSSTNETTKPVPAVVKREPFFAPGLAGKKITLDAGHGGNDAGAIGPTGVTEKSITLRVVQEVQRLLTAAGSEVLLTRSTDTEVSAKHALATDIEELQARCDVANDANADIFLSIHMDSFASGDAKGTTGYFYGDGTSAGHRLADQVQRGVVAALGTQDRGTKSCNFYVVRHTVMPAALVEVAFVSNPAEEKLMDSPAGVKKAAEGIVAGLRNFFGS